MPSSDTAIGIQAIGGIGRKSSKNGVKLRRRAGTKPIPNRPVTTQPSLFADKTYDRSHVMEFPRHPEAFVPRPLNSPVPITQDAIDGAFNRAANTHKDSAIRAKNFLDKSLAQQLAKLGLGWGNRLESQMNRFVPVIIEAGGTLGEAADHILATKLLRKLRGRFDLGAKQLEEFQNHLIQEWDKFDKPNPPVKCFELLEREIKRLNGGAT